MAPTIILGISTGHDAAATVLADGKVASHIVRERISGIRHHYGIDRNTIELALSDAGLTSADVTGVAVTATQLMPSLIDDADYFSFEIAPHAAAVDDPVPAGAFENAARPGAAQVERLPATAGVNELEWAIGFLRHFETDWRIPMDQHRNWSMCQLVSPMWGPPLWRKPFGLSALGKQIARFIRAKSFNARMHYDATMRLEGRQLPGIFVNHHVCHAASAFFSSSFTRAAIVTHDGGMNVDSGFIFVGHGKTLRPVGPHCVIAGQFYDQTAIDLDLGFMGGAGKLMGLAGFGKGLLSEALPAGNQWDWRNWARDQAKGEKPRPIFEAMLAALRAAAEPLGLAADAAVDRKLLPFPAASEIAWAAQSLVERTMLELVKQVRLGLTEALPSCPDNLCLSGGVALNCPANTKIHDTSGFANVFIEPHCEDSGISLGAAHYLHACVLGLPVRKAASARTSASAMLGQRQQPLRRAREIARSTPDVMLTSIADWPQDVARRLAEDQVVAIFQGRSEAGPRALGHRSILANPSRLENWQRVNTIKGREHWRPFAPAMLAHRLRDWFADGPETSPFMLFTYDCIAEQRARIPAVIHHDGTSRVQTVTAEDGALFAIIEAFERLTGLPLVMNTSFNGPGEPIIETVERAIAFLRERPVDALYIAPDRPAGAVLCATRKPQAGS